MKKKLLLTLTFISALGSAGLTGCSGAKSIKAFEIPEGGFDTTKEVTVTFYTTMGDDLKNKTQAYIDEFQELYPNIKVEMPLDSGSYDNLRDQIKTELAIDEGPDVAYCYPDHVALYNKKKVVVTLDNLINDTKYGLGITSEQKADFFEGYYKEGQQFGDGLMYSMPWSKSTEVMYYNKTVFDEEGLSVPTHWFNTSESDTTSLEYVCKQLKAKYPDSIPFGYDSSDNWFITMCEQLNSPYTSATGSHFLFDNAQNRDFLTKFKSLYSEGLVTTKALNGNSNTSNLLKSATTIRSFMSVGSSAGGKYNIPDDISVGDSEESPFEIAVASIPQADPSKPRVISQGPSVCILNQGDPQKVLASWLFVRYMTTSVAYQAEFAMESGYLPVIKSVINNPTYAKFLEGATATAKTKVTQTAKIKAASAKLCMEATESYFTSPAFYGSSEARSQVGLLLDAVISNSKTMDQAFKDALDECEYKS